jgi:transcriptional regulator with XRE-family HTH domain
VADRPHGDPTAVVIRVLWAIFPVKLMHNIRLAQLPAVDVPEAPVKAGGPPLQRLAAVRRLQGISLRALARRLETTVAEVRSQQRPTSDIWLSQLYRWQRALEVPAVELLSDSAENLAAPIQKRAQLLRLMRTAVQISEAAEEEPVRQMALLLMAELTEIMPELESVSPWHSVGRRRRGDEYGVAVIRGLAEHTWRYRKAA